MRKNLIILACALSASTLVGAQNLLENNNSNKFTVKDFPVPSANQKQIVIELPAKATPKAEQDYKVELIPGKMATVDCNHHGLNGAITEETVEGMGMKYYRFDTDGNMWSTRMGCPDNSQHEEFVTAKGIMTDYNSRLPLVMYVPEGYEVRYRIWAAGEMLVPETLAEDTNDTTENLYGGKWQWVSSTGGYAGKETALENTGMSKSYSFRKDGSYLRYKNGKMVPAGKFRLSNDVSIFIKGKLPMIEFDGNDRKMSYTFVGCDTLILSEECFDCYKHTYIRKK